MHAAEQLRGTHDGIGISKWRSGWLIERARPGSATSPPAAATAASPSACGEPPGWAEPSSSMAPAGMSSGLVTIGSVLSTTSGLCRMRWPNLLPSAALGLPCGPPERGVGPLSALLRLLAICSREGTPRGRLRELSSAAEASRLRGLGMLAARAAAAKSSEYLFGAAGPAGRNPLSATYLTQHNTQMACARGLARCRCRAPGPLGSLETRCRAVHKQPQRKQTAQPKGARRRSRVGAPIGADGS
jgi:hypothetical protein